jgi:hypothetical protein
MSDTNDTITISPWLEETLFLAREEGEAIGEAKAILLVLKTRLGAIPTSVSDAVYAITDPILLENLTILASTCKTLDEFEQTLK